MKKLLKEVGVTADADSVKTMISKLDGQDLPKLINEGYGKFAACGGGGAAAPSGGATAAAAEPVVEEKEAEPEADVNMGGLFGDEDEY